MSYDSSSVELSVEFIHETEMAVLISDGDTEQWIPKSQLVAFNDWGYSKGEAIEINVSEWFAYQHDLI